MIRPSNITLATEAHRWRPLRRCLHAIDLENLGGGSRYADDMPLVWRTYQTAIGVQPGDHAIIAAGVTVATRLIGLDLRNVQLRFGRGIDGADNALLDAIDITHYAKRFNTIIIASGDHAFAPLAQKARQLGMRTWMVAGRGLPSRALSAHCQFRSQLRVVVGSGSGLMGA